MNSLHSALAAAVAALDELSSPPRPWALVGGLAMSARAEPRFTRDADIVVSVASDAEAEKLVFAMRSKGFGGMATVEHETARSLATRRD